MERAAGFRRVLAALVAAGLLIAWSQAEYFGHEILAEVIIFAILAISLDVVAGYGGMVSLGHGALFGVGAYVYAMFSLQWNLPPLLALLPACLAAGAAALAVGALTSRTHGIFFIMITLAIGEMGHEFFFQSKRFGGDDGLAGIPRPDLTGLGIDLVDPASFSMLLLVVLAAVFLLTAHLLRSPFGATLQGLHANEGRMRALGLPTTRYKAAAMGASGLIAGLAGALAAMHAQFISPSMLSWQTSGEVLIMVILGGLGSLVGAVIGAIVVVTFKRYDVAGLIAEHSPCDICTAGGDYWHFWLGALLILVVVTRSNGVAGVLEAAQHRVLRRLRRTGSAGGAG
jgi:branched-chain amino acid transport system permease protein